MFTCLHRLQEKDFLRDLASEGKRGWKRKGERLKQTYSFTTKSVFFCRQPYSNHKLAFSALLREQHVCLGEKNGIKYPVHVSTLALFVLTEGLVKRTVYCTLLLNLLAQQTIIQHFLYNVEHVLMMLFTH